MQGSSSAALILSAELGGGLPLWTFNGVHVSEGALASPQPLLAGGYTLISSLLKQNLRRATFSPPLYLQARDAFPPEPLERGPAGQPLERGPAGHPLACLLTRGERVRQRPPAGAVAAAQAARGAAPCLADAAAAALVGLVGVSIHHG